MTEHIPLLAPWSGTYGGVPPFDRVKAEDLKPALLAAIAANRADIAAIAGSNEAPTFENTIAALEDAGRALSRVGTVYNVFTSSRSDKAVQSVETEMAPVLAAFSDEVTQNAALFARIKAVYEARNASDLTHEQRRLVSVLYRNFVRHGASLPDAEKKRLAEINQRLAALSTEFSQNVLADEDEQFLLLESEADLAGLSAQQCATAAATAAAKGFAGRWAIANTRSDIEPFLTYSARRDLREKAFRLWTGRGEGVRDNKPIVAEILALRAEKAKLLGYSTFAHWVADDQMAKTPDAALDLMMRLWKPAVARVREDVAQMQRIADAEGGGFPIAAWDYRYYAEKLRIATYDLDQAEVKAYLQADKMLEAALWVAGEIFGLEFSEVSGVPVVVPETRVFELRKDEDFAGLFYNDPFARPGKQSGAWMSEYRTQERFRDNVKPIVSNNTNFMKSGETVLISWDDAITIFHEFGHGLHGLLSNVTYPSLAGTNVVRDFVEFPSQIFERWLATPEVLSRFARHHETDMPMPEELVEKIRKAKTFNTGFVTVEYLASAIVDMKAHLAGADVADPAAFEQDTLREIGMPEEIVMRHRLPHFGHLFSGEAYAAGYYDYIWADALVADAAEAFEAAGFFDRALARRLHDEIISVGNTIDAAEAFRRFRGRDVCVDALMRERGFAA